MFSILAPSTLSIVLLLFSTSILAYSYFVCWRAHQQWPILSTAPPHAFIDSVISPSPAAALRAQPMTTVLLSSDEALAHRALRETNSSSINDIRSTVRWISYVSTVQITKDIFRSGCAGVMLAYAAAQCTIMNMGSVMMVYLLWAGVSCRIMGSLVGLTSICGKLSD
jgi:hypothetical protein